MTKKYDGFEIFNSIFMTLICIITLYPFWHCLIGSIIPYEVYMQKTVMLWPDEITFKAYIGILQDGEIFSPFKITVFITVVGTAVSLFITSLTAYGLSKKFVGAQVAMYLIIVTMFLHPGLIPNYILYRSMGIINKLWVYILPTLCNTFFMIIMRTHFIGFSKELEESARIDGCNDYGIFFRIVLPLSKATLATIGLFYAVNFWNTLFPSLFFVNDVDKKTLQDYLYQIIQWQEADSQSGVDGSSMGMKVFAETIKLANVMITALPIIAVYPFVQKYFVKGVMIGAVKG